MRDPVPKKLTLRDQTLLVDVVSPLREMLAEDPANDLWAGRGVVHPCGDRIDCVEGLLVKANRNGFCVFWWSAHGDGHLENRDVSERMRSVG